MGCKMSEIVEALAGIGHNEPPEETPFDLLKKAVEDLRLEAGNFLDGKPIENQEQADALGKILDDARKLKKRGEEERKDQTRPLDDEKAVIMAAYKPLVGDNVGTCDVVAGVCKKALTVWLNKLDEERKAKEKLAREEAEKLANEAKATAWASDESDLEAKERTDALLAEAAKKEAEAKRLDRGRAQASGGARSVGLRTVWHSELENSASLLVWLKANRAEELKEAMMAIVRKDVSTGSRVIPGVRIWDTKEAV